MSRLRDLRLAAGLTQVQLADAAGLAQDVISRAERGERGMSLATFVAIADALALPDATLAEILRELARRGQSK